MGKAVNEKDLKALETLQQGLLTAADGKRDTSRDMCVGLDLVAASVPHVAGLIQARLPRASAEIYSPERLRELLREFASDLLTVQRRIAERQWRARKRTRAV